MTTARDPEITDELLSAYIDEDISDDDRRLIEQAAADDPDIAWRLATLRETVRLLHELPALALPRSFLLTPEQVGRLSIDPAVVVAGSTM
jgi:anti-sigma factor RsiW